MVRFIGKLIDFARIYGAIFLRPLKCLWTRLLYGGTFREKLFIRLLELNYQGQFHRAWVYTSKPPHFFNQRWNVIQFLGNETCNPYGFFRGFLVSQILRKGDGLLDIGCGDGFFAKSFYAYRCSSIDGVDIEPSAIQTAQAYHQAANIHYYPLDATQDPFPKDQYDIIAWDGTIGHFSAESTKLLLKKIGQALHREGIFVVLSRSAWKELIIFSFFKKHLILQHCFSPIFRSCGPTRLSIPCQMDI